MELAKKFRYFEFQKKSMERKAMIIKDGYYFSLWDAVRITQIGHKWAGYTGEEDWRSYLVTGWGRCGGIDLFKE